MCLETSPARCAGVRSGVRGTIRTRWTVAAPAASYAGLLSWLYSAHLLPFRTAMRFALLLFALPSAPAFAQTTWYVDASATGPGSGTQVDPFSSLQFGLNQPTTLSGDTLVVAAGTYIEQIDFVGKDVIVDGSASGSPPVLDGGGAGSVVTFRSGETAAVLRGFVVRGGVGALNGSVRQGGGLLVDGASPLIESVRFIGNNASYGGGAFVQGGSPVFDDCTFEINDAWQGGALFVEGANVTLTGSRLVSNRATGGNGPAAGGAVVVSDGGALVCASTEFSGNVSAPSMNRGGGAVWTSSQSNLSTFDMCFFGDNLPGSFAGAGFGGAILAGAALEAADCVFERNGGFGSALDGVIGGGAASGGTYTDCVFRGNVAQLGGALWDATAIRCRFEENQACADGGGQGGATHSSDLTDCTLIGNWTCGEGGGSYSGTMTGCDVRFNTASPSSNGAGQGGGVARGTVADTVIHGNAALSDPFGSPFPSSGGGVFNANLERCVVSSNFAEIGGGTFNTSTVSTSVIGNARSVGEAAGIHGGTHVNTLVWHNPGLAVSGNATFTVLQRRGWRRGHGEYRPATAGLRACGERRAPDAGLALHRCRQSGIAT